MYISGTIVTTKEGRYVCLIRTPGIHVMKSSIRSREEALTEALKFIGLPMKSDS